MLVSSVKIQPNNTYPGMFHAVYPDGTPSADFYNITRAKEHSKRIPENERLRKYYIARESP